MYAEFPVKLEPGDLKGFPIDSDSKNLPVMQETWIQSLGWKDTLEKRMATHTSILV